MSRLHTFSINHLSHQSNQWLEVALNELVGPQMNHSMGTSMMSQAMVEDGSIWLVHVRWTCPGCVELDFRG